MARDLFQRASNVELAVESAPAPGGPRSSVSRPCACNRASSLQAIQHPVPPGEVASPHGLTAPEEARAGGKTRAGSLRPESATDAVQNDEGYRDSGF